MHAFRLASPLFLLGLIAGIYALPLHAAPPLPAPYEGLVQVKSRNLDAVYLLPSADFRDYSKIMIDPVQVSFRKDWVKETNRSRGTSGRITDQDAQQIAQAARSGFETIFAAAFKAKGYEVVASAAPDVLRLSPAIANLYINAPLPTAGPGVSRTYTVEAGEATLALEARDSTTGALLGLAVDRSATRRSGAPLTTSTSNRAEFEDLFRHWANICVKGLEQLKAASPVSATGPEKKR